MNADDEEAMPLSVEGQNRRDRMLHELVRDMQGVHRRRQNTRRIAAASIVPVLAIITWIAWNAMLPPAVNTSQIVKQSPPIEQPQPPSLVLDGQAVPLAAIEVVHTDPSVSAALTVPTVAGMTLSDEELLAVLASIDRPTGLIRSEGRVWLTSDVADPEVIR